MATAPRWSGPVVHVLLISYFAPLADHQAGGVQQWVHHLLPRLVARGLKVTVVCPERPDGELLRLGPRLRIWPELHEPGRRALLPDQVRHNHDVLARRAADADVLWVIDRHLPIPVPKPVVLTWTTVAYRTELEGLLGFNWDVAVAPSPYMVRTARALAGPACPHGSGRRVLCVPIPVDVSRFRKVEPHVAIDEAEGRPYLLFPHRPDAAKGFDVALEVMRRLARAGAPHRLLVPLPPASVRAVRPRERRMVRRLQERVAAAGLSDRVAFYPWAPASSMPGLYSAAEWTLVLSRLPEGFVLAAAESIACRTPVLATPAGALPEVIPARHGLVQAGFRDPEEVTRQVLAGPPPPDELERGSRYVAEAYDVDRVAESYLRVLTSARKTRAEYRPPDQESLELSPWCRLLGPRTLWHDHRMRMMRLSRPEAECLELLARDGSAPDRPDLVAVRRRLLEAGVLVPTFDRSVERP